MAITEQSTNQTQTEIYIPKFAYPFKENQELKYLINSSKEGNYLFNTSGFWHGGVHFIESEISTLNGGDSKAIKCIADGEIVAYRVNDKYLKNDGETSETKGVYSTGFFLVRHKLEYPKDNKLTFFSLYMHTAKKSEYLKIPKIVKHDLIKENSSINSIVILSTPKPINAGDIIAIAGLYNTDESEDLECLHLEVFTDEKIETFIEKSKDYARDTNPNKPKSKDVEIVKGSKKYKFQNITKVKLKKNSNIREGFSNTSTTYQNSATPIGTILFIDKNTKREVEQHTRYKVLKIGESDVSAQNLTVAQITFDVKEDVNNLVEDAEINERLYVKALEEVLNNGKYYVKIGDNEYVEKNNCKQSHPITFSWARIFKDVTQDKVSIFKDLKKVLNAEESEFTDGFRDLFLKMDKEDHNGKLNAMEIEEATRDVTIKTLTSKYIVSHPNEWKYEESKWGQIKDMLEDEDDKRHIEKEQKRIENLSMFEECKTAIAGFPEDANKVYHINPIGLIGAFGISQCGINVELLNRLLGYEGKWFEGQGRHSNLYTQTFNSYINVKNNVDKENFISILLTKMKQYNIDKSCIHVAHFLTQIIHESDNFNTTLEYSDGSRYEPNVHSDAIRMENTRNGDGTRYRGRGLIQLTWKKNYRLYGEYKGKDFISNPDLLGNDIENAIDVSCYFWRNLGTLQNKYNCNGDINILIDNEPNDVSLISQGVNGGRYGHANGLEKRKEIFMKIVTEFNLNIGEIK